MRIACILGPYFPVPTVRGGAVEKNFLALCEEFARRGHEVTIISRQFEGFAHDEVRHGVRHLRVKSWDPPKDKRLYHLLDVIYAMRVRGVMPSSDVTMTNGTSLPLILPRRRAGKIYVDVARYPKGQMSLYRRADRLQVCSTHIAEAVRQQSPSVAHLVKTIPNTLSGVFAERAMQPNAPTERAKEIIYVGRVAREKGIVLLLKAFSQIAPRHPGWRLRVVGPHLVSQGGDGPEFLASLQQLAKDLPVDFMGPVFDDSRLAALYEGASLFVYPSLADKGEAFPVAPLEAMACGCPPVVSDLRCFRDAVASGKNGMCFDHTDATGTNLALMLERLIASDALRIELSDQAKMTSLRYSPIQVADLFLDDFASLTGLPSRN